MSDLANQLLPTVGRTSMALALAALCVAGLLRWTRVTSPTACRAAWLLVLLVGWTFLRIPISVPWYESQTEQSAPTDAPYVNPSPDGSSQAASTRELGGAVEMPQFPASAGSVSWESQGTGFVFMADEPGPISGTTELPLQSLPPASINHAETSLVPTVAASAPRWRRIDWPLTLGTAWLTGLVLLPLMSFVGYLRFLRRLSKASRDSCDEWHSEWRELLSQYAVRREIPLRVTENLGPLMCRLPRGYELLVPLALWQELDAEDREAILRHELAHYLRGDVWKSLAVRGLALAHWFNPAAWWAVHRFDEAAEWACDQAALVDSEVTAYARVLLKLGSSAGHSAAYSPAFRGRPLAARIRRVLTVNENGDSIMKKIILVTAGLLFVGVALVRVDLVASDQADPPQAATIPSSSPPPAEAPEGRDPFEQRTETGAAGPVQATGAVLLTLSEDGSKVVAVVAAPTEEQKAAEEAAKRAVDAARIAFERTEAAYDRQQAGLEALYTWSLRWLSEEERAAGADQKAHIDAIQQHLERMKRVAERVKAQYKAGVGGVGAEHEAATTYYVAEAERRLAEAKAAPALRRPAPNEPPELPPVSAPSSGDPPIPSSLPSSERNPFDEPDGPDGSVSFITGKGVNSNAGMTGWAILDIPRSDLRYDGQSFDEWAKLLQTELSTAKQADAIRALAAFAPYGYGRQATREIIRAMRNTDVRRLATLKIATNPENMAISSFGSIGWKNAREDVLAALKAKNLSVRLFAVQALRHPSFPQDETLPLLREAMQQQDESVRSLATLVVCQMCPGVVELRSAMKSLIEGEEKTAIEAIITLQESAPLPNTEELMASCVPTLISVASRENTSVEVRLYCIQALIKIATRLPNQAKLITVGLEPLTSDKTPEVMQAAKNAIAELRPTSVR